MLRLVATASLLVLVSAPVAAQSRPGPPATWEEAIQRQWQAVHQKLLAMAKDTQFPEEKLGWKPHPDARSVLDELRHVTIGLEMSTAQLKGEPFNYGARDAADKGKPATRASLVSEMETALEASMAAVRSSAKPVLVGWIEHQGEHYGKLVTSYRALGLVPPQSRP